MRIFALAAALLLLIGSSAHAHGRDPFLLSIAPAPHTVVGTSFGLLYGADGGKRWEWICEEAVGYNGQYAPLIAHLKDGGLLVAAYDLVARSDDQGCSWTPAEETRNLGISGLAITPSQDALYVTTATGAVTHRLLKSTDGGRSFHPTVVARDEALSGVLIPPAAPNRIYVTVFATDNPLRLLRSDDNGRTFQELPHPEVPPTYKYSPLAVDPIAPDVLFTRTNGAFGNVVWRSEDAGQTFSKAFEGSDAPWDLVFLPDGNSAWLLTSGGIYQSHDRGRTFTPPTMDVVRGCAATQGNTVLLCGDITSDGWLLGQSVGGAAPWVPLFTDYPTIAGVRACTSGAPTTTVCATPWAELSRKLGVRSAADAGILSDAQPADAQTPPEDSGIAPRAPKKSGGCSTTGRTDPAATLILEIVGLTGALVLRKRRFTSILFTHSK